MKDVSTKKSRGIIKNGGEEKEDVLEVETAPMKNSNRYVDSLNTVHARKPNIQLLPKRATFNDDVHPAAAPIIPEVGKENCNEDKNNCNQKEAEAVGNPKPVQLKTGEPIEDTEPGQAMKFSDGKYTSESQVNGNNEGSRKEVGSSTNEVSEVLLLSALFNEKRQLTIENRMAAEKAVYRAGLPAIMPASTRGTTALIEALHSATWEFRSM